MLAITVNDRPLGVSAVVERGRILVPMSATFEALGASISYNPHTRVIVASSMLHTLRLRVGSELATVDGKTVRLDVPAHEIAARTYVPLRFVAQAMGAVVGYDAAAQIVTVTTTTLTSRQTSGKPEIMGLSPAPDAAVASAYPTISATLGMGLALPGSVTLKVDGTDVTQLSTFDGTTIMYMPRTGLKTGLHTVVFSGRTNSQVPFTQSWSFSTSLAAPADGNAFSTRDMQFYTSGQPNFYPGDTMHFVLVAPPNGHAVLQLCSLGSFPLLSTGGTQYILNIPAPSAWIPSCQVTAVYTSWNGTSTYVPVPLYIGVFTLPAAPTPRPHPHSTTRPILPEPRRTDAPVPVPARTPHPIATPRPLPTPRAFPTPREIRVPEPVRRPPVIPRARATPR